MKFTPPGEDYYAPPILRWPLRGLLDLVRPRELAMIDQKRRRPVANCCFPLVNPVSDPLLNLFFHEVDPAPDPNGLGEIAGLDHPHYLDGVPIDPARGVILAD